MSFRYNANNCPICAGEGKHCRQGDTVVFCLSPLSSAPPGWKFLGLDKNRLFAKYVPDTGSWSASDRERYQREMANLRARRQREEQERRERIANGLTEEQRDAEIRKVLAQLSLRESHRQDLRRRGLTDVEIEAGGYRSVSRYQQLKEPVSPRLPGVGESGKFLTASVSGYLCPIRNILGQWTGWQLRADAGTQKGKYLWAPSPDLPNGEWPLQVAPGTDLTVREVCLAEGVLKPAVAAALSGRTFLGAAGGQFLRSPQQLLQALQLLGAESVCLTPDANGVANEHVYRRDCQTVRFLQSHGFKVRVGVWGQPEGTTDLDIDELLLAGRRSEIQLLEAEAYLALGEPHDGEPAEDFSEEWDAEPDAETYEEYRRQEAEREQAEQAEAKQRERAAAREFWRLSRRPDKELNSRYLPPELLLDAAGNVALKSEMGTGKTLAYSKRAQENIQTGRSTYLLSPTRALGREMANRCGIPWVDERTEQGRFLGFGVCPDSFRPEGQGRILGAEIIGDLLVDEAEHSLAHLLLGDTCKGKRIQILRELAAFGENCKQGLSRLFLADAHLSDPVHKFWEALCGRIEIVQNHWQPGPEHRWNVTLYDEDEPALLFDQFCRQLAEGKKLLWVCDGQKSKSRYGTRNLEALIRKRFPELRVLRIDSETQGDPTAPAYGAGGRINDLLAEGWDCVVASTSICTGVSIDSTGLFDAVYGAFNGVVSANAILQAMARVRENVERHLWVRERGVARIHNGAVTPQQVIRSLDAEWKRNAELLGTGLILGEIPPGLEAAMTAYSKLAARLNEQMGHLRESVVELLQEAGHMVSPRSSSSESPEGEEALEKLVGDEVTACRNALWREEAKAVASEPLITQLEADRLKKKESKTPAERRQEEKRLLHQRYGGVEVTEQLKQLNDCGWHPRVRLHYLLTAAPAGAVKLRDKKHLESHKEAGEGAAFLPDLRLQGARLEALSALGIAQFLQAGKEWHAGSPEVLEFQALCLAHRSYLQKLFGLKISSDCPAIRLLQHILRLIGCRLSSQQLRRDGERVRLYSWRGESTVALEKECPGLRQEIFEAWRSADLRALEREAVLSHQPL